MALQDYLTIDKEDRRTEITKERVDAVLSIGAEYIAYWREYPDRFIDFLKGEDSEFELFAYQRLMLRQICRNKYYFGTFPRA